MVSEKPRPGTVTSGERRALHFTACERSERDLQLAKQLRRIEVLHYRRFTQGGHIPAHALPDFESRLRHAGEDIRAAQCLRTNLGAVQRDMIAQALADCAGSKSKAAARLGISRTQLYVRLRRYQLS